ncbi:hypothetical protein CHUAL_005703 [Chamberlinius hualienensis]
MKDITLHKLPKGIRLQLHDGGNFSRNSSQVPLSPGISLEYEEEALPERGTWTGRFDFLLSLLGYSVGLGNVWRCFSHSIHRPVAIYEKFCPLLHGVGYGMVVVSGIVMLYYNMLIAWTLFYMYMSMSLHLPWEDCAPEWSTPACYSYNLAQECSENNGTYFNRTCYNSTVARMWNITETEQSERKSPAQEYFTRYMLGLSSGIEETGEIKWSLAASLALAWLIVFLCLSQGVKTSGKVVYFTALFPYVVLVILFFRGVTLPGASDGILFYLMPDWSRLASANVWGDAAVQIFFALSPAWGGLITLASYNKFNNNCYKDALIVSVSNILTSFFAGFVIFSVIGFLAFEMGVKVDKVVEQGAGLAFTVYPEVVKRLPVSPLWAFLFFFMLLTLGLDSQFALMETVTTAILDRFPALRERKLMVVLLVTLFGYVGGLIFCTNAGMYWLQLMDKYAANWSVLVIAVTECVLIAWCYGADRFLCDIQEMIGVQSYAWRLFWKCMWKYLSPATLLFILIFNWIEYTPASYGHYVYPKWADAIGWILALLPVFIIVVVAISKLLSGQFQGTFLQKLEAAMKPSEDWGLTNKGLRMNVGPVPNGKSFDNPSFNKKVVFFFSIFC